MNLDDQTLVNQQLHDENRFVIAIKESLKRKRSDEEDDCGCRDSIKV
jgi:hypothetical protein